MFILSIFDILCKLWYNIFSTSQELLYLENNCPMGVYNSSRLPYKASESINVHYIITKLSKEIIKTMTIREMIEKKAEEKRIADFEVMKESSQKMIDDMFSLMTSGINLLALSIIIVTPTADGAEWHTGHGDIKGELLGFDMYNPDHCKYLKDAMYAQGYDKVEESVGKLKFRMTF